MKKESYLTVYRYEKWLIDAWSIFERKYVDGVATEEDHDAIIEPVMHEGMCPSSVKLDGDVLIIKYKIENNQLIDGAT